MEHKTPGGQKRARGIVRCVDRTGQESGDEAKNGSPESLGSRDVRLCDGKDASRKGVSELDCLPSELGDAKPFGPRRLARPVRLRQGGAFGLGLRLQSNGGGTLQGRYRKFGGAKTDRAGPFLCGCDRAYGSAGDQGHTEEAGKDPAADEYVTQTPAEHSKSPPAKQHGKLCAVGCGKSMEETARAADAVCKANIRFAPTDLQERRTASTAAALSA